MSHDFQPQPDENKLNNSDETGPPPSGVKPPRIHWRSGLGIVLGGVIAEAVVVSKYSDDDTLKIYITLKFVFPIVAGLLILWWVFRSGFSWLARLIGICLSVLGMMVFLSIFRLDRFEGAMRPQFSYRWTETPEQRVARYFQGSSRTSGPVKKESINGNGEAAPANRSQPGITDEDWPRFRGAQGDGVVGGVTIRTDWSRRPPQPLWKHPVGPAWSSFAVVGERLFTQEQRGKFEAVVCYDAGTGEQLWLHTTDKETRYSTLFGGTGPRATPTLFGSRLYSLGATGILNCLDPQTGKRYWETNILKDAGTANKRVKNLDWGMAGSPLVFDDMVVVNPGGEQRRAIIAYDRHTGELQWARGEYRAGYAAPRIETLRGMRQVIIYDAIGVGGYDPETGEELWRSEGWSNSDRINVAQPIVRDNLVLISSGYGTGSMLLELNVKNGRWTPSTRWRRPGHFKLKFNDAVYKNGYLYGLDEGILACINYRTGKKMWKRGRYGHGQMLLIDDDDLLLIQAESGEVVLVEASPDRFQEVTRFTALEEMTWNHPVVNRGFLYVRNFEQAACYDLRPRTDAVSDH